MSTVKNSLEHKRNQVVELVSDTSEGHYAASWMGGYPDQLEEDGGIWTDIFAITGKPLGYRGEDGWTDPAPAINDDLRAFIEGRLAGYVAFLENNAPDGKERFPDSTVSYALTKVQADSLQRLLRDYDETKREA